MPRIKIGTKVEINGQIRYIQAIKSGKPYPYYVHVDKECAPGTPLAGPYGKDDIKVLEWV